LPACSFRRTCTPLAEARDTITYAGAAGLSGNIKRTGWNHDTETPVLKLKTWFTVGFLMPHPKKGMSALQIKRTVFHDKASYETVWYMCTRIRAPR
jgi:hypothetical protein